MRGSALMIANVFKAIPTWWMQSTQLQAPSWMGAFMRTEVFIRVRGRSPALLLFFEVGVTGRLWHVQEEANIIGSCTFQQRIQVVGTWWQLDLDPDGVSMEEEWQLWAWDSRPLARLQ